MTAILATTILALLAAGFVAAILAGRSPKPRRGLLAQVREWLAEIIEEIEHA